MWVKIGEFTSTEPNRYFKKIIGTQEKTALYPKQRCIEPCYIEGAVYKHNISSYDAHERYYDKLELKM